MLSGCTEELEDLANDLYDAQYVYPENKDVVVTLEEYDKLETGMSEQEVWDIVGGKCTNTGETDLGMG